MTNPTQPPMPGGAGVPGHSGLPDGPGFPDGPGLPDGPGFPDGPGLPDGRGVPEAPGLPDGPAGQPYPGPGQHTPPGAETPEGGYAPPAGPDSDYDPRGPHHHAPLPPQGQHALEGHDRPQAGGEHGEDVNKKHKNSTRNPAGQPEQVRTAYLMWVLAGVASVISYAANLLPGAYRMSVEEFRQMAGGMADQFSDEQVSQMASISRYLSVVLVVLVVGVLILIARQMRKGKNWARALLLVVGFVMVAQGVLALFALFSGGGADTGAEPLVQFITLTGTTLAGLFAGVAVWQMSTEEARKFFEDRNGVSRW